MQIEIATIPIRQMGIILSKVKCCLYFLVYQLLAKLNYFLWTWLFQFSLLQFPVRYALSSRMNCYYHPIHFLFNPFSCRFAFLCSLLLSNNEIFEDELRNEKKNESCLVMMFRRAILFIYNDDMESTIYKKRLVFTSSNSFRIL